MIDINTQRDTATKAAKDLAESTVEFATKAKDLGVSSAKSATENAGEYVDKAMEFGGSAADSATDAFKAFFDKAQSLTGRGLERVSEVQVGEKNVGERVQATVDTVEQKIDVDQIQDQVAKLREQMEHVLVSWKDSFRPSTTVTEEPVKTAPAKKAPAKAKATTTKSTATKKASAAKKTTKVSTAKK